MEHIHTGRKAKTQKARWHAQTMNFAILQSSSVKSLAQQTAFLAGSFRQPGGLHGGGFTQAEIALCPAASRRHGRW